MQKNNENSKLFNEFPSVSTSKWKDKIVKDLKGADYDKKLMWNTLEGFKVKPFYRSEDIENLDHLKSFPADFPFVRGNKLLSNDWLIRQDILVQNVEEANKKALDILMKGITSLGYIIKDEDVIGGQEDFNRLFKGVLVDSVAINLLAGQFSPDYITMFANYIHRMGFDPEHIYGSVDFDPIGYFNLHGKFFYVDEKRAFERVQRMIAFAQEKLPKFRVITINGQNFNNAGANIIQDLAFTLSVGNEYLAFLTEAGLKINDITPRMQFNFAVGSNYFLEIAKLRAARYLWSKIVQYYDSGQELAGRMYIHTETSSWNKSVYDPYVNMLRTTTESMSSIIAGTDSHLVKPFDASFTTSGTFSERIARNQQILLKEEAHFNKIVDPAGGSYYIESLTDSMIEHAWKIFLDIEDKGGYLNAFKSGFIQEQIKETVLKRDMNIALRKEMLLGTNQYPNFTETVKNNVSDSIAFPKITPEQDAIAEPLRLYRGAVSFEKMRLKTENSGKRPKVFMFTYGNLAMRRARSQFSSNFFACAGFEVIDNNGFLTVDEGVEAALKAKADVVVVCSSDDEYPNIAPDINQKLNNKAQVVIAGYPKDSIELLQKSGIKHFIHIKSNVLETLKQFQAELGIN